MIRSRIVRLTFATVFSALLVFLSLAASCSSIAGKKDPVPPKNNLVYEIFVRSFCDGDNDSKKDPKAIGDLKGIVQKLDSYLNDGDPKTDHDLEVGILWLMPIFPSPSYHGYDVTDYRAIHPDYGTLDDFKLLIKEAHRRGVRIILDIPFNHTSNRHPWFQAAVKDKSSPFRSFYQFEPDNGPRPSAWHPIDGAAGEKLRYFGLFDRGMPDLNFDNPKVKKEVKDIAKFWLDLGVNGFRLDAAKHIFGDRFDKLREPEILRNNDWWLEFSQFVYRQNPEAVIFGEVLGDAEVLRRHAWGLDGLTNEPFMNDARNQVSTPGPGFIGRYKQFVGRARELNRMAFNPALGFPDQAFQPFDFVASHDRNPRLASDLEEMKRRGMNHGVDEAYRLAMYMLLTVSTRPILYQGDEVMQRGWKWNGSPAPQGDGSGFFDETLREPFPWYKSGDGVGQTKWFVSKYDLPNDGVSREEQNQEGGMLHLLRGLNQLRARHSAMANGDIGFVPSDSQDWMVFEKFTGAERYLVLINQTATGSDYRFHQGWFPQYRGAQLIFWSDGKMKRWQNTTVDQKHIQDTVFVPPFGMVVIRQAQKNPG